MKTDFELIRKVQKGAEYCIAYDCVGCPYNNTSCDVDMMKDVLNVIEYCFELQEIIDESGIVPTLEEAKAYLRSQGFPEAEFADNFCTMTGKRRAQFWECVRNNYDLSDFERWQHFQNVIKGEISWNDFCKIYHILNEYDIEIIEMDTKEETLYGD